MAISPSTPVTGSTMAGLTSPTYTIASGQPPDVNAKSWQVTALGGTQTGVTVHSASSPFSFAAYQPKSIRTIGKPNPVTGLVQNVPKNDYVISTLKGVTPLAGQPVSMMLIETRIRVPAGADVADPLNVKAALSAHFGLCAQVSSGIGDTTISGTV